MKKSIFFIIILFLQVIHSAPARSSENSGDLSFPNSFPSEITLKVDDYEEKVTAKIISSWLEIKTALRISPNDKSEAENIFYCPSSPIFCDFTITASQQYHQQKESRAAINEETLSVYISELGRKVNKEPVEPKFKLEDGKVTAFSDKYSGLKLKTEESRKILAEKLLDPKNISSGEIMLSYEILEPKNEIGDINNLNINTLIGEGTSNFRGSPKNRIFNINVATSRFNGILIKPGEEFSFVKVLGPVDAENGYLPELVIKRDKTEPEFGGGICQVSTTTFRAAIYSGLKITARRNHAYPVGYYNPQGLDATVYIPWPDLRFINNTPGYILIQTKIEGTQLIFQFYGTDDGRKTEIVGPKILERKPDGSMKTTFTQKVSDSDGKVFIEDIFNSNYDSPNKYPHPGEEILKEKPKDWTKGEWKAYKKAHGI